MPIPAIPGLIAGALLFVAGHIVSRVLISLGVAAFAFVGIDQLFELLENNVVSSFNALPADVLAIASIMKLGVATKMVFSSGFMALTLKGLKEGSIVKMFVGLRGGASS
jgi:hypothetical protein